jgi:signal transduction histidine kinase
MNHFSISASHELKTPLTILRGEIELALKSPKTPEQYRETLQSNYEETIRLINIVEHLFYLSKIDNAIVRLNKQTIELESFIKSVTDNFLNLAKEKNIKINLNFAENKKIKVDADPELFKQVVINLVENAIKYGNESSDFDIICKSTNDGNIFLSFSNYAEAIPKETLSRLFERFYRVETSRNRGLGGVGLGLAIVKSIVDLHNWKINVKTENNVKIIFTIII